jgi:hypothetical protein
MEPPRPSRPEPQSTSRPIRPSRPTPSKNTVEIPKAWLAVIAGGVVVAVLVALLLVVAFLMGRVSGRNEAQAPPVDPAQVEATVSEAPVGAVPTPVPWPPLGTSTGAAPPLATWPPPAEASRPPTDAAPRGVVDSQAAAVGAYLAEIESYGQQASSGSPQELAMTLMNQGMQGDTSGFERLLESQRTAQRQIESMTVPVPCREHHSRTLEALRQSLVLGEKLQRGMASGDLGGLLSMSSEARELEAAAGELKALEAELRRQFGLPS